jgi:STE24 endopeptidase
MIEAMHALATIFGVAVVLGTLTRWWLGGRQMRAVEAHRDQVPEAFVGQVSLSEHQKAADYTLARVRLGRLEAIVDAAILLGLTLGGGVALVDRAWRHIGLGEPWLGLLVIGSVLAIMAVLDLPFELWRTFRIEARFGFNRASLALFVADRLKGIALALVLGTPLLLGALTLMAHGGRHWWIYAWIAWLLVSLGLAWAWPVWIAPLFNRFSPLEDAALRARIESLLARCGFAARGVFVVDGSRRSAHGNAYFTGFGRNKRIVFFDTLLERLGNAEVEAVLAHELGHFRLHHVRQRLIVGTLQAFVGLALLALLLDHPQALAAFGLAPSTHATLLIFLLVVPAFAFFLSPLAAWWSRRHEFAADRFAAQHASAAELAEALVKLYRDNATTLTPDRVSSAFYDSHPPALVRIAHLKALAAA